MNSINKEYSILEKFKNLVNNANDESKLNGYIHSWNKYKNYFSTNNEIIKNEYEKINDLINNKIIEIRNSYLNNQFNQISCISNLDRNTLFNIIQNYLFYHINTLDNNNYNSDNISLFIDWLRDISKCYDLSIFKPKIYELVEKFKYVSKINKSNIYNEIIFKNTNTKPMLLTDFFNKSPRTCSVLKEYECNEDCYWSNTWYDRFNPFASRCKPRDFKELIINSYCSNDNYKTREEKIDIIKLFFLEQNDKYNSFKGLNKMMKTTIFINGNKTDLNELENEQLCKILRNLLDNYVLSIGNTPEEQISFWNKYRINNYAGKEMIHIITDSINNKYTLYQIIKRVVNHLKRNGKTYFIASVIAFFTIMTVYYRSEISCWMGTWDNSSPVVQKINEQNYHNNNDKVEFDSSIKDKVEILKQNGYNLERIAGSDGKISVEEMNPFFTESGRLRSHEEIIEYSYDVIKSHTVDKKECINPIDISILVNTDRKTVDQDQESLKKMKSEVPDDQKHFYDDLINFLFKKANYLYRELNSKPNDYNEYENITKKLGYGIEKNVQLNVGNIFNLVDLNSLKEEYGGITIDKIGIDIESTCKDVNFNSSDNIVEVLASEVNGKTVYYIFSGLKYWAKSLILNENNIITANVHHIGEKTPTEYFQEVYSTVQESYSNIQNHRPINLMHELFYNN